MIRGHGGQFEEEEEVESTTEEPRSYEDNKSIIRPRFRESGRRFERWELLRERLERFFGKRFEVTFDTRHSSQDLKVPHKLGRIPEDIIFGIPSANAVIYKGVAPWTDEFVFLRSTAACTVRAYLVVR